MKKGLAISLIVIISGSTLFFGFLWGNNFRLFTSPTEITPTIDGVIEDNEWRRAAYYNIPFYLDVDNSLDPVEEKQNVDGWNYLSVAEDDEYYYIGLDLCSDRTNNNDSEWISFFLANRLPEIEFSKLPFMSIQDYGFEYIFYDVENDKPFDYQLTTFFLPTNYYDVPYIPEVDNYDILLGETDSDYLDFWYTDDNKNYTIASEDAFNRPTWLNGSFVDMQFGINITQKFPDLNASQFMSDLSTLVLNYRLGSDITSDTSGHVTRVDEMYCAVLEHGPSPGNNSDGASYMADTSTINFAADTYASGSVSFNPANVNATNGMFYFSVYCFNEDNATYTNDYELYIDHLSLRIRTTTIGSIVGNSIADGNYDIAWTYGTSDMCSENHRMFEFKVAKSEFVAFSEDKLYLFVAGYGTMSFLGTNYWAYPGDNDQNPTINFIDHQSDFLVLDMSVT